MFIVIYFFITITVSFLIQCFFCFKVKHRIIRHGTLLLALIPFALSLRAYNNIYEKFNDLSAIIYALIGIFVLIGYGLAWLYFFVIKNKRDRL